MHVAPAFGNLLAFPLQLSFHFDAFAHSRETTNALFINARKTT